LYSTERGKSRKSISSGSFIDLQIYSLAAKRLKERNLKNAGRKEENQQYKQEKPIGAG
jgi:hypothetical protein